MSDQHYCQCLESAAGCLKVETNDSHVKRIGFCQSFEVSADVVPAVMEEALQQLKDYFEGKRTSFDLPLDPVGTEFQQLVWQELTKIAFGTTISYKELALRMGSADKSRAVGMANGKNPIAIIIPCHRVIGEDGKLVGYAGGLEKKKWLLRHEESVSGKTMFF